ncbi:hypothetical protein QYF36_024422 [Acer negundo]|nr:hypothetical protein QYF36_024422 [Acer negundo]
MTQEEKMTDVVDVFADKLPAFSFNPPYHDPVSSPAYVPVVIQPNSLPETLLNTGESDGRSLMHNLASAAAANVIFNSFPDKAKKDTTDKN